MPWYRITDFLKTRLGHLSLFALAVIALFFFAAKYFKKKENSEALVAIEFPRLGKEVGWATQEKKTSRPLPLEAEVFQHEEPNSEFSPFRPPALIPEHEPLVQIVPEASKEALGDEDFVPLNPLIKFQSKASRESGPETIHIEPTEDLEVPPEASLKIEVGAVLYAHLAGPLSSELAGGVVTARLSRPLRRGGEILAPKGASLIGTLKQTAQNRLYLSADWKLQLADGNWLPLRGEAQEASLDPRTGKYALSDGQVGLPGLAKAEGKKPNPLWSKTLETLASVTGRLAQDRVRTAVGDYVPGTARNVVLESSSQIIEQEGIPFLTKKSSDTSLVVVEAGRAFYLSILP